MQTSVARAGFDAVLKRLAAALLLTVFVCVGTGGADIEGPDSENQVRDLPSIRSAGGRFVVAAESAADRMLAARWADEVYRRFSDMWGWDSNISDGRVFGIFVAELTGGVGPFGIDRRRHVDGNDVVLALRIESFADLDAEAFVEQLCALFLDDMILSLQDVSERGVFEEEAPAWLSAGIAQNLYPSLRKRNQTLALSLWKSSALPAADEILTWRHLPSHRTFEKAVSGVWVAWASECWPQRTAALKHWIGLRAEGLPICSASLFANNAASATVDGWEPYVASLQRLLSVGDQMGAAERYARLRQVLRVDSVAAGLPPHVDLKGAQGLDALLTWRKDSWLEAFARTRRAELTVLIPGSDQDYRELVARGIDFLDRMLGRRPGFMLRREYRNLMQDVDARENLALAREHYLSLFKQRHYPDKLPAWFDLDGLDAPPPSSLRSYVDGFELP